MPSDVRIPRLKQFHPSFMGPKDNALLCGKKQSGKTTTLLDLMYDKKKIPEGIVLCGTADSNEAFDKIVPSSFVYSDWDTEAIKRCITRQTKINKTRKERDLPKKYMFIVSDDNAWDSRFANDPMFRKLLMNGRWYGMTPMYVTTQNPLAFKPADRNQFDWIFLFRDNLANNRKRLYDNYGATLGTYKEFQAIFDHYTEKYGCLIIKNCGTSNLMEDNFFWYRAKVRDWRANPHQKKWHMGSRAYWRKHFELYDKTK